MSWKLWVLRSNLSLLTREISLERKANLLCWLLLSVRAKSLFVRAKSLFVRVKWLCETMEKAVSVKAVMIVLLVTALWLVTHLEPL